jgi:hypothetical protein
MPHRILNGALAQVSRSTKQDVAITIDIDWAPDFVIESVARLLIEREVRATWFVTHPTPVLRLLRSHPELFELGIHPNFLPGSSHGATPTEVIDYCLRMVPDAMSVRTHALVQSTPILQQIARDTSVRVDVSLYLPRVFVAPFQFDLDGGSLTRVPYQWEDDFEMSLREPNWDPALLVDDDAGSPLVLDFHPIHIYLNSESFANYAVLKTVRSRLSDLTPAEVAPFVHMGTGTGTAFEAALRYAAESDSRGVLIRELEVESGVTES